MNKNLKTYAFDVTVTRPAAIFSMGRLLGEGRIGRRRKLYLKGCSLGLTKYFSIVCGRRVSSKLGFDSRVQETGATFWLAPYICTMRPPTISNTHCRPKQFLGYRVSRIYVSCCRPLVTTHAPQTKFQLVGQPRLYVVPLMRPPTISKTHTLYVSCSHSRII